jgi:hypothetical protein
VHGKEVSVFKVQRFKVPIDGLGAREGSLSVQGSKVQGSG